jgi:hypothetical protein
MATTSLEEMFGSEAAHRLRGQAKTIVEQFLRRRNQPRGRDIYFRRGSMEFALIHGMVTDRDLLVALLDEAAQALTREEDGPTWRISTSDPFVSLSGDWVTVMLHPEGAQITGLTEVPDDLRIFNIDNTQPFRIREVMPSTTKQIAYAREHAREELATRRQRFWNSDLTQLTEALVVRVRAELAVQQDTLPAEVVDAIKELLARSLGSRGMRDLLPVLEAYSYLGLTHELLTVFTPQSASPTE